MARKHHRRRRALRRGTWKPRSTYASRARDQDKDLLLLMLFDAIEEDDDDLILPLAEAIDNGEDATQWRIRLSQRDALSGGDGKWRKKIRYGSLSNYGGAPDPPVSPREFYEHFRITQEQVPQLVDALKLADVTLKLPCGGRVSGEECLLIYLKRMAYPCRLVQMQRFFGRSKGYLSEAVNYMQHYLYDDFAVKLVQTIDWDRIRPKLKEFARAIHRKGAPFTTLALLLDGTFRYIARPGGRKRNQRSMYSGRKKGHGLNYQGLGSPDGILIQVFGPKRGPTHDLTLLRDADTEQQLRDFATVGGTQYVCFGDLGYTRSDVIQCPHKCIGGHLSPDELQFNNAMKKIREPIEWAFGRVLQIFPFVDYKKNLKIRLQPVAKMFATTAFLTNCITCMQGHQTADYFACRPPTLAEYLANA